ncbi:excalibur calcium-binding domain-containing protein [Corynebacterium callunae]|uniref:Lipoprotein n=1 Tax=Corynebacterium callunae DSM 20147 TaxID=1121353 RepID=M1TRD3_9CORY|nr:excalibur calcium-binding domain-containing protein [Corynebacterium callunae]AGG66861.1 lipoprotein [Corynebacterium callunae DSM 20147]
MTTPFEDPISPTSGQSGERKSGCVKWGAILGAGFIALMIVVPSCGSNSEEAEAPVTTITQTVTQTITSTPQAKTVTQTSTITAAEIASSVETSSEIAEPVVQEDDSYLSTSNSAPQRFATIPDPEPATVPQSANYASCAEARAAGVAPIYAGSPGYRSGLDRDGDGIACDK